MLFLYQSLNEECATKTRVSLQALPPCKSLVCHTDDSVVSEAAHRKHLKDLISLRNLAMEMQCLPSVFSESQYSLNGSDSGWQYYYIIRSGAIQIN